MREVWEVRDEAIADVYKGLARRLGVFFRATIPGFPHDSVHGYVPRRSTRTNALAHIGEKRVLKADLRHFFRSVRKSAVVQLFERCGLGAVGANVLASIVSREDHIPLGLPTSPTVANAVCHDLDCRLASVAPSVKYTRYADDMTFSGVALPSKEDVEIAVRESGFVLAEEKWRFVRAGRGLYVTGLSLEDFVRPRIPKALKRRLKQDLYYAEKRGLLHHLGRRGCANVQSGVNHIDGMIRYVRGIEPAVGNAANEKWQRVLAKAGLRAAFPQVGEAAGRAIQFIVDESVVEKGGAAVLVVAVAIVEDAFQVGQAFSALLASLQNDPDGGTEKGLLAKEGIHWAKLEQNDRTSVVGLVRALPFRAFIAFAGLPAQDRATYEKVYRQLFIKLVRERLIRYANCRIDVLVEDNNKINLANLEGSVTEAYQDLVKAESRRPSIVPRVRLVQKLAEDTLPLADVVLGIFGDYARSHELAAAVQASKKKPPGALAEKRFDQIRDKIRAIFDIDRGAVSSRRRPFNPW